MPTASLSNWQCETAVDAVAGYGWLGACEPAFREWVLAHVHWHRFAAGAGISHTGDSSGALFCVGDGQVSFVAGIGAPDIGSSYFALPGMWWGYGPLLGALRVVSAVATVDSICGALSTALLKARLATHPQDWRFIALGLAATFAGSAGAHADLLIPDSDRRIAATILRLGGYRHFTFRVRPPPWFACTQEQLAGATALSRNTVGKALRRFEMCGLLETRYGGIAITDSAGLADLANAG
jgi:CRP/FNR family transcriptional regulator, cyclic AMP receptor protein